MDHCPPPHNPLVRTSEPWRSTSSISVRHAMSTLWGTSHHTHQMSRHFRSASSMVRNLTLMLWTPTHSWGSYMLVMFLYAYFLTIHQRHITNNFFLIHHFWFLRQGGEVAEDDDEVTSTMNWAHATRAATLAVGITFASFRLLAHRTWQHTRLIVPHASHVHTNISFTEIKTDDSSYHKFLSVQIRKILTSLLPNKFFLTGEN